VSPGEKIEILVLLSADADESLRLKAQQTLVDSSPVELEQLLADAATPRSVIDYLASHLVPDRPNLIEALLENPGITPDVIEGVKPTSPVGATAPSPSAAPGAEEPEVESPEGKKRITLLQRINAMTPVQKIKAALTGNQEERLALIKDPNKLVSRAVLASPKVSGPEIEAFAAMRSVMEEVLRTIATSRRFMKNYAVARALINNPRSPLDITLPLVSRLNDRDLKSLSINKNVPEALRAMAAKFIKQKQDAQRAKIYVGKH